MRERKYEEMTNLKKLIKRKNISYRKLAEDMHMSLNAINNKLNGYTVFNIYEAEKMMIILGIGNNEIKKYFFGAGKKEVFLME